MKPSYEELEERLRDANNRIAELRGQGLAGQIRSAIGLSPAGARLLSLLYVAPGLVSSGLIWSEVFSDPATGDGPCMETVKVRVCQARRRFKELGHDGPSIVNEWGFGYRLMPDARAFIAARLQPMEMAA